MVRFVATISSVTSVSPAASVFLASEREHAYPRPRARGIARSPEPRAYDTPAGQSRNRAAEGGGSTAHRQRRRQSTFRFGASQPRALPGAARALDVGEGRRASRPRRGRLPASEFLGKGEARPRRPMLRLTSLQRARGPILQTRRKSTATPAAGPITASSGRARFRFGASQRRAGKELSLLVEDHHAAGCLAVRIFPFAAIVLTFPSLETASRDVRTTFPAFLPCRFDCVRVDTLKGNGIIPTRYSRP